MLIFLSSLWWNFNGISWWRYQMKTFSVLLAICAGNSPVTGEFPAQRLVTRSFDVFFDLCLNKRLSKQSWGWWFETLSRPLCVIVMSVSTNDGKYKLNIIGLTRLRLTLPNYNINRDRVYPKKLGWLSTPIMRDMCCETRLARRRHLFNSFSLEQRALISTWYNHMHFLHGNYCGFLSKFCWRANPKIKLTTVQLQFWLWLHAEQVTSHYLKW